MDFYRCLSSILKQIPPGKISTYKEISVALGDKGIVSSLHRIIDSLQERNDIPWYRVINDDGTVGGRVRDRGKKKCYLESENFKVFNERIQNYQSHLFTSFRSNFPLKKLRKKQESLASFHKLEDSFDDLTIIGGVDVSYESRHAFGAYVAMDYRTREVITTKTIQRKITFPYIPTYFAFREIPVLKPLLKDYHPSLLLVDGHGLIHPFTMGIACHLGIMLDVPTIGVAKSLLLGTPQEKVINSQSTPIIYRGQMVGWAIKKHYREKPIYVSPGYKVAIETSRDIVKELSRNGTPEPLRQAHLLSRQKLRAYRQSHI